MKLAQAMRMLRYLPLAIVLLAGCQLPLTPEDLEAREFKPVPGKAVIYLVRINPDFNDRQAQVRIGDKILLKVYPGTYYRWVVDPGKHTITGYAGDIGTITVQAEAGRIYYVRQQMTPLSRMPNSQFFLVNEKEGRAEVLRAVLLVPDP
jgi:hypothetical protein